MKAEDRDGLKTLRLFRLWLFCASSAMALQSGGRRRSENSTALLRRRSARSAAAKEQVEEVAQLLVRGTLSQLRLGLRDPRQGLTRAGHGQKQIEMHNSDEIENSRESRT